MYTCTLERNNVTVYSCTANALEVNCRALESLGRCVWNAKVLHCIVIYSMKWSQICQMNLRFVKWISDLSNENLWSFKYFLFPAREALLLNLPRGFSRLGNLDCSPSTHHAPPAPPPPTLAPPTLVPGVVTIFINSVSAETWTNLKV